MNSPQGIPSDGAAVLSVSLEGILYGFSILMFTGTIWALTYNRRMQDVNRPITAVAILLLILSTAHIVVNIIRVQDGLVKYRDTFPGGPVAFFGDITQVTYVIKHALYMIQTLLADGVVIYRCYVVWKTVWVIIVPSVLWCGGAVTGVAAVYDLSQASRNPTDIFTTVVADWIKVFIISTLVTNLLSSGLLAYRIWMLERSISTVRTTKSSMMPIVRVLVDAAILYTAALVTRLIFFIYNNNGQEFLVDMITQIISIAFYMVLVRIPINEKTRMYHSIITKRPNTEQGNSRQRPTEPMSIRISQSTHGHGTLEQVIEIDHQHARGSM
ncbi:hypothetical protein DEU56DRAFT_734031 [Suillus clintonianus]|uniref:uncharacterized protein n=1 Tax=Suillus clintonianus TaxID=1904413 RepID=UPI001B85EACE|nr:uncharacterized protein DEU56DRAFT_734031 [Suillus clintonianus]KAG2141893.1 hypothetical protein DEU56DRAFT_734031 [Suillus clintonianus]